MSLRHMCRVWNNTALICARLPDKETGREEEDSMVVRKQLQLRRLERKIRYNLRADREHKVTVTVKEIESLVSGDPPLPREARACMRGWYQSSRNRAPTYPVAIHSKVGDTIPDIPLPAGNPLVETISVLVELVDVAEGYQPSRKLNGL